MNASQGYRLLADGLLILHAAFVAFVVFGLVLIVVGGLLRWAWVRNFWFRLAHLSAIGVVVALSWCNAICPLTRWENRLRELANQPPYENGFVQHWLGQLIFFEAPPLAFTLAYTVFGALVACAWIWVRPRPFRWRHSEP